MWSSAASGLRAVFILKWERNYFSTDWGELSSEWSTSIGLGSYDAFFGLPGPRFCGIFSLSKNMAVFLGLPLFDFCRFMFKPLGSAGTTALVFLLGRYKIYYYNLTASRKSECSCYTSSSSSMSVSWATSSISVSTSCTDSASLSVISSLKVKEASSSSSDQECLLRLDRTPICYFWPNFWAFF